MKERLIEQICIGILSVAVLYFSYIFLLHVFA